MGIWESSRRMPPSMAPLVQQNKHVPHSLTTPYCAQLRHWLDVHVVGAPQSPSALIAHMLLCLVPAPSPTLHAELRHWVEVNLIL